MNTSQVLDQHRFVVSLRQEMTLRGRIRRWLSAPVFEGDEEKTRVARLLNSVLLSLGIAILTLLATLVAMAGLPTNLQDAFIPASCLVLIVLIVGLRALARRGQLTVASATLISMMWIVNTIWIYTFAGTTGDDSTLTYAAIVVLAGLLLGKYGAIITTSLTLAAIVGMYCVESVGIISIAGQPPPNIFDLIFIVLPIGLVGLLLSYAVNSMARALDLARSSKNALAERTRELEASQRVTFAASERTTPDELLNLVVNLIRDQFDLYHVQVYLVDREQGAAVLHKSTGYAGRQLLQKEHRIPLDRPALVTKAIREGKPTLVADVSQEPEFMPNPLLPETKSELVVPMKARGEVIGVLDAQDRVPSRFAEDTAALFQTMADQVAFLFENSELLSRVTDQAQAMILFSNQLRTAADIARRLGAILDPDLLLQQVIDLMQSRFGFYHVHIYLLDEKTHHLVVRAGSGEVGQVLREQGHSIPIDTKQGLVARAAREQEAIVVSDTNLEPDFMPNPLLPQTRSEVAVPLLVGEKVLGVLDVQDDQVNRFVQSDVDTFNTLAGQIAVALQNAKLFGQVEENLAATQARLSVTQALANAQTEDEVLDAMVKVANVYPKSSVYIHLIDQSAEEPILMVTRSATSHSGRLETTLTGTRLSAREFPLIQHITPNAPFVSPNLAGDERVDQASRVLAEQMGIVSVAAFPITAGSEWIGVIIAASGEESFYDERKCYLYQSLAEHGAVALQTACLQAERERYTAQLRVAADLAEQINVVLNADQLLQEVVNQLRERFDLYHVHVYLLEQPSGEALRSVDFREASRLMRERRLVLRAGSGEVGQALLEQKHNILLYTEKSLVARAARTREIVSVGDTSTEPTFLPNPLLHQTRSEVALPLFVGDNVLGVLDVQDSRPHRFTQSDLDVLSSLAGQIATALQNASLFEEVQETAERLREVDRLKSEFLANMSHELRTPLNSIIGYTEIMLMGIDSELDPETLEDVQAIYDNGQHLLRLINDVLDLAKIEAGHLELNVEKVEIKSLVEEVGSSIAGLLANKPVGLSIDVEDDLPLLQGDRVRINQILYNLLSNAAKFTDKGHIALRAHTDRSDGSDDGWICIEVEDTGTGIGEEDLEKIFERFQQADGSNSRKAEGTGLGLAITRHLVQMHGGTIGVQSRLGEGATFTVRLPIQYPDAGSADRPGVQETR